MSPRRPAPPRREGGSAGPRCTARCKCGLHVASFGPDTRSQEQLRRSGPGLETGLWGAASGPCEQPVGPERGEARPSPGLPAGGAHARVTPLGPLRGGGKGSSESPNLLRAFLIPAPRPHLRSAASTRPRRQVELAGCPRAGEVGGRPSGDLRCNRFLSKRM